MRDMALKFIAHFVWIAVAMNPPDGDTGLWDEEDGFYYDVMRMPDGAAIPLKVRSLVGLLPLCAATVFEPGRARALSRARRSASQDFVARFSDALPSLAHLPGPEVPRAGGSCRSSTRTRLRRILAIMLDEDEFLGAHGIRAISRRHLDHPYVFDWGGQEYNVHYLPAESDTGMFGGNSNWRGPVWFPMNLVILRGAGSAPPLLRRPAEGRVPDRLRRRAEPARGRHRDRRAPRGDVHRRRGRPPPRVRRDREVPDRPALARPAPRSTSTSTATTAPASAPAIRPAGPAPSRCSSCRQAPARSAKTGAIVASII